MALGEFRVHAGDFKAGRYHYLQKPRFWRGGKLVMRRRRRIFRETVKFKKIVSVEPANQESVKRAGGTIGWGVAGAALLGPMGMLAGLIAGGQGADVTFVCKLKDGRKFLGTMKSKDYAILAAAAFK